MTKKRDRRPTETDAITHPAVAPRSLMDDDRPTEIFERESAQAELVQSRQQIITGSTIREIMNNSEHKLSGALSKLLRRAREDLPKAEIDPRASLMLWHDFEFER